MAQSVQIKSVKVWHEELIDFMLAQPRAGLKETSEYFGVSMSWISIVKNSDAFREQWDKRREGHSSAVSASLIQRVEALAEVALETMQQKLEREGESIGLSTLREVSETALKSLGFGMRESARGIGTQNVQNNTMIVVDRETLARAREARSRMQQVVSVPSLESPNSEQAALLDGAMKGEIPSSESPAPEILSPRHEDSVSGAEVDAKTRDPPKIIEVVDDIPPRKPGNPRDVSVLELFADPTKGKK